MLEPENKASSSETPGCRRRRKAWTTAGLVLLAALGGAAAYATWRQHAQDELVAQQRRREAALEHYLGGLDLLRRDGDVATIDSLVIPAFEQAVAVDPTFAEAQFSLGEARARVGRPAAATASYRAALRLQPENAAWLVRLADHLLSVPGASVEDPRSQALDCLRRASEAGEAGGAFTKIGAALLHADTGAFAEANAAAEAAAREAPHLWEAWVALGAARTGMARISGGRGWDRALLESALEAYEEASRLDPTNARCAGAVALVLRRLGRHEEAVEVLDELVASHPRDGALRAKRGLLLFELGQVEAARRDLDLALRLTPDSPQAHETRGRVRLRQGDPDGALEDLSRALQLAPGLVLALSSRAQIRLARGQPDLAIADLTLAMEAAPQQVEYRVRRGAAHMQAKRYALAAADFRKVVETVPGHQVAWANLGATLLAAGDAKAAEKTWTRALERVPRSSSAHLLVLRGRLLLRAGRAKEAALDLEAALALGQGTSGEPLPPAALLLLSRSYRAQGLHDAAAALIQRALKLSIPPAARRAALRELGDIQGERGRGLLKAGRPRQALIAFEKALSADAHPSHAYGGALAAVAAGEIELALRWLERGFDAGLRDWRAIEKDRRLGVLLEDPRLRALLERMGAPAKPR